MGEPLKIADWLVEEWEHTYAPLNVSNEIEKMKLWLAANPKRAKKKNWARFVVNWLNRAHAQVVVAQVNARVQARTGEYKGGLGPDYSRECDEIKRKYPDLG